MLFTVCIHLAFIDYYVYLLYIYSMLETVSLDTNRSLKIINLTKK